METNSKPSSKPTALRIGGMGCVALAVWLVISGMGGKGKVAGMSGLARGPESRPFVTKRERLVPTPLTREQVRQDFDAERRRGMTEQEVRWIMEDLKAAGIYGYRVTSGADGDYFAVRKKHERWYVDTLAKGFRLNRDQRTQVAARLRELGKLERDEAREAFKDIKGFAGSPVVIEDDGTAVRSLMISSFWANNPAYDPRTLCDLDDLQLELAWPYSDKTDGYSTYDYGTEERYIDLDDPFLDVPILVAQAGTIFPLSMVQVDGIRKNGKSGYLQQARTLTSAQLKALLVFHPVCVKQLMMELEMR